MIELSKREETGFWAVFKEVSEANDRTIRLPGSRREHPSVLAVRRGYARAWPASPDTLAALSHLGLLNVETVTHAAWQGSDSSQVWRYGSAETLVTLTDQGLAWAEGRDRRPA